MSVSRSCAALLAIALLASCQTVQPPPIAAKPVQLADGETVVPAEQAGLDSRVIELSRVQVDIPRGTEIGRMSGQFGNKCLGVRTGPIYQEKPRVTEGSNEWNDTFYRVMNGHGYRVADGPNQLFQARRNAELQFGVIITEMKVDASAVCDFFSERAVGMRATSRVAVEWQVFDPVQRQVILKQRGEGAFQSTQTLALDGQMALQHAFADAVNKLAALPELRTIMLTKREVKPAPVAVGSGAGQGKLPLRRLGNFQSAIDNQIDRLRSATVLIEVGASGHGSGFIVSEDGLMITNRHVSAGQRFLRVRLVSGRTVVGEVLREHEQRDVALVKLEGSGYPTIPIRETPVRITEEVYAIGAPQRREFAWTVTRGVVSAWRPAKPPAQLFDEIQADVAIHGGNSGGPLLDKQGNLVAICVTGFGKDNMSINQFIPILDGLEKLGLELLDAPEFERRRRVASGQ